MAYQGISTGTGPNTGTGDSLLNGAVKINNNFTEIYNALGDGTNISNFKATTPSSAGTTGGVVIKADNNNKSRVQFTNPEQTSQYGYLESTQDNLLWSGNLNVSGNFKATTPSSAGTTGGVVIKADNNNKSRVQFVDPSGESQYGYLESTQNNLLWSGNLNVGGNFKATTPSSEGTTGGVVIKADNNNKSRIQFTNPEQTSQYGYLESTQNNLLWSGNLTANTITANTSFVGPLQYSVSDGDGLTVTGGSFNNSGNITFNLGTPSDITSSSTNSVTASSHTHALANGSVTQSKLSGIYGVKLWGAVNGDGSINNSGSGGWTSVRFENPGKYTVTFDSARASATYLVMLQVQDTSGADEYGVIKTRTANSFDVRIRDENGTLRNSIFSFIIID